jgi:hypothetical protein
MTYHKGEHFTGDVVLDGNEYVDCSFTDARLIFRGGAIPSLVRPKLHNIGFEFEGPADRTIGFLSGMYQGGFAQIIEMFFEYIRTGKPPEGGRQ